MTKDEAFKRGMELLRSNISAQQWFELQPEITVIKEALSQPEQEPFGYVWLDTANFRKKIPPTGESEAWNAVYTTPPAQPEQEPVLQDIEQYRLQMAGISTAAIGYWKEGDGILPDYDTTALRDVAKLYSKYDALYKARWEKNT